MKANFYAHIDFPSESYIELAQKCGLTSATVEKRHFDGYGILRVEGDIAAILCLGSNLDQRPEMVA